MPYPKKFTKLVEESKDLFGCVYLLRCIPSGKVYVGSAVDLNRRMRQYSYRSEKQPTRPVTRAIKKYGFNSFDLSLLHRVVLPADIQHRKELAPIKYEALYAELLAAENSEIHQHSLYNQATT